MTSWYVSSQARSWTSAEPTADPREFHRSLPGYEPTSLTEFPTLAAELGVGRVLVKDESKRLGLPAFKVLGASWACRQVLDQHPGAQLVTATDGNHGRAVARMAKHFDVTSTVFVPKVMIEETAGRIAAEGAEVVRVDGDYDEAVRAAARYADDSADRALVQDTAWQGYTEVPAWIVEGYQTLLHEIDDQLQGHLDLIAVPVGVGSLAEAVVRHYRRPGTHHPTVLSVEPDTAACVLASLGIGHPATVATANTVMAGLNCGTVSGTAWPVLRDGCDAAVAVTDAQALRAVADLATLGISSGASGAATLAGVRAVLRDPARRAALDLGDDAVIVLLSTEGNPS
ncbi:PLP-dependent lyase/thiolase [Actinoplanes italicus]|uniref:Diaminopropionate ammonia-lyase n=1 Tax=Actinoplanes italicus TaxID=113567 RepID=A0A2T0KHU3_9ACTN|nr:pyridoxal-phosphate dependent enzyme [Actinoplanes italicus]PRX23001.1 diaminopropionate ammonia-lyase [Actinoplanes italicus]GIE28523.1 PLP-dependent lyase/thiolase [Actinoplanes italicus]